MPKFLCVKGILFFSFWQSIAVSLLVAAGAITRLGPYTDREHISLGLRDCLICIEMPFFAWAHMYAFSYKDFVDPSRSYVARMPMYYALRDAFGLRDVVEDSKATLRGEGMDYRHFEPSEGYMHQGEGRERRIRAGLRYSKGGKRKYWLPQTTQEAQAHGRLERGVNNVVRTIAGHDQEENVYAPLLMDDTEAGVRLAPDLLQDEWEDTDPIVWGEPHAEEGFELPFGDISDNDEQLFAHSRKYLFGDYNYPCIDISSEYARGKMWDEEERILRDERSAWFSSIRGGKGRAALQQRDGPVWAGYGAVGKSSQNADSNPDQISSLGKGKMRGWEEDTGDHLVDYEGDRTPAASADDVQLKWTNTGKPTSRSQSHSQPPHIRISRFRAESSSSPSSSNGGAARPHGKSSKPVRSPPDVSPPKSSVLPSDAVDLIVEHDDAADEECTREQRKGDPAVRGSVMQKVYHATRDNGAESEPLSAEFKDSHEDQGKVSMIDSTEILARRDPILGATEGALVRAVTPPVQSQPAPHNYDIHEAENPWA